MVTEVAGVVDFLPTAGYCRGGNGQPLIGCGLEELMLEPPPSGIRGEDIVGVDVELRGLKTDCVESDDSFDGMALLGSEGIEKSPGACLAIDLGEDESVFAGCGGEGVIEEGKREGPAPVVDGALTGAFVFIVGEEDYGSGFVAGIGGGWRCGWFGREPLTECIGGCGRQGRFVRADRSRRTAGR